MVAKLEDEVAAEIKAYIDNEELPYDAWYAGITDNPRKRLFEEHKVGPNDWIYRQCFNAEASRRVEDYFVNTLGTKGDCGGGDENSVYVYAYKITSSTVE